jgi:hypothetical protein
MIMNDRLIKYLGKEFTENECNRIFGTNAFIIWNSRWTKMCNNNIQKLYSLAPSIVHNWMKEKYEKSKQAIDSYNNGTNDYAELLFDEDMCKTVFLNAHDATWRCSWKKYGKDKFMKTSNGTLLKKYMDENIIPDLINFIQDYDEFIASSKPTTQLSSEQIEKLVKLVEQSHVAIELPTIVEPAVVEPAVVEPVVVEPVVVEPAVVEPAVVEPAVVEPAVVEPVVVEPAVVEPAVVEPVVVEPVVVEPAVVEPAVVEPAVVEPVVVEPVDVV